MYEGPRKVALIAEPYCNRNCADIQPGSRKKPFCPLHSLLQHVPVNTHSHPRFKQPRQMKWADAGNSGKLK
jgi:hypothetical protein